VNRILNDPMKPGLPFTSLFFLICVCACGLFLILIEVNLELNGRTTHEMGTIRKEGFGDVINVLS
jgi:hypothetical protein